jgi:hypothetical protein
MHLETLSEGILYRNPSPGLKAECAYLPNVVALSDTQVLSFYRIGSAFYSADGRLAKLRSTDGGKSWVPEGMVWDPRNDQTQYSYTAPHATRLRDGTLLLVARRWERRDPDAPIFNPQTGGSRPGEHVLFRSTDDGHTWSTPETLDLPGEGLADTPSQIIELKDGRWFLACELWKGWDDTRPLHIKGFAVFSDDKGKTWTDREDLPSATDRMYSHSRYTQMLDGRIAALQWTQEVGTAQDLDLHLTVSDVTGKQWSNPRPTGIMGQTSWLADLGDQVLVATYTSREGMRPGICVVLSVDGGQTWGLENQVMVWDAVGQEFLGVEQRPSYPASHDNIAFGKPNTARLPNGEIICSWWCTQACVTHARWARLRAV